MEIVSAQQRSTPGRIRSLQIILLILVGIISYGALILPVALRPAAVPLQVGDVSPSDFQAPESITYESQVQTEQQRLAAENAVAPVYASPEPSIARGQIERLRTALQYITLVRNDGDWGTKAKLAKTAADKAGLKQSTVLAHVSTRPGS